MTRLTTAQALVRWLIAQRAENVDGDDVALFPGVFAIFGHGNVLGMGTALGEVGEQLPTWRAQNEQGMALAAAAFAKATQRRQVMVCTSSIGPGALNMVTAAGVAHANRLPMLLLPGDTFSSRAPDPVLQQVEDFGDATVTVNDAFRPVSRLFDRITRPEQLLGVLPQVARVLTDPADCGPVVLALPQDVQAESWDFPDDLFAPRLHRVPRPRPDERDLAEAVDAIRASERPLLIVGGGVRYSDAAGDVLALAEAHDIPFVETTAGRTLMPAGHRLYGGPLGITGSSSANELAGQCDLALVLGSRLQDFTTASWTVFPAGVRIVHVNAARFDSVKHGALSVVGDARETVRELQPALGDWRGGAEWAASVSGIRAGWERYVSSLRTGEAEIPTYAQVVGVVDDASTADDYVLTSSGGMPGELVGGWCGRGTVERGATMDVEYGFSCMGYEIAGAWGAAMARQASRPGGIVTTLLGDGSYLMLNSEIFSAAFAGHPFVAVVCDNGGYAVIARLQEGQGAVAHNNMFATSRGDAAVRPDFAAHAASLGANVFVAGTVTELRSAYGEARETALRTRRPSVVVIETAPDAWTESGAFWQVGVPETLSGSSAQVQGRERQRRT